MGPLRLVGRTAIVTGAASGIGLATAARLRSEGASIVAIDLRHGELEMRLQKIDEVASDGQQSLALQCDVSDEAQVADAVASGVAYFGSLDILANVAGVTSSSTETEFTPLAEWERVIRTNLTGPFLMVKHSLPHLRESPAGRVINVASTAAFRPSGTMASYIASKGGLTAMTRGLVLELVGTKITANSIAPGAVDTSLQKPDFQRRVAARKRYIPLQRAAKPSEIASIVAFLASDDASYVTGQTLAADGGASEVTMI